MDLLKDWIDFCQGTQKFDAYHFTTLFHQEKGRPFHLDEIFSFFPEKEELKRRMAAYSAAKSTTASEILLELVKNDVAEKQRVCQMLVEDELAQSLASTSYSFVKPTEFKDLKKVGGLQFKLMAIIGDYLEECCDDSLKTWAMTEAFYGLTQNQNLVWYLGAPFYHADFNPDLYFEIWRNSGDYIVGEDGIYVLNEGEG